MHREFVPCGILVALGSVVTAAPRLQAAVILDANYQPELTHTAAITTPPPSYYSNEDHAKTFRVQNSGAITRVEVRVGRGTTPGGPLLFDLRTTRPDGSPSDDGPGVVLATGSTMAVTEGWPAYQWISFDNLNVPVTFGEMLAIVLQTDAGGYYGWGCRIGGTYADGLMYRRATGASIPTGGLWTSQGGFDTAFKVWIDTSIPEPASLGLLGVGSAAILSARRLPL